MPLPYRGRFAPSPTGPLHFGSLIAAVGSYCEAKSKGGEWLVRIEDLDRARESPGASENILTTLAAFGFKWDRKIVYQSERQHFYQGAFNKLEEQRLIYPCICSRKEIADFVVAREKRNVYPGTCRNGIPANKTPNVWRIRVPQEVINVKDQHRGIYSQNLSQEVGDFVLKRADGSWAYQLAVVVDDAAQGVTHVVRGADLLDSTPRQIYLQRCLGFSTPQYLHLPIAVNASGEKLSKQTLAEAVEPTTANLVRALEFLNQSHFLNSYSRSLEEVWDWALANWDSRKLPTELWRRGE